MSITYKNRLSRAVWNVVWLLLFRPFPTKIFNPWRLFLLRIFGAKVHKNSGVYASCKIWAPWNLILEHNAWLGPYVDCYNAATVKLEKHATVSQKTYLCTASHNIFLNNHSLITAPITIKERAWVGAAAYIGLGVTVGEGAVVGATASVYKDVDPWTVVGGNPAKFLKKRIIKDLP